MTAFGDAVALPFTTIAALLMAAGVAAVMRRALGAAVGRPRTILIALIAMAAGVPLSIELSSLAGVAEDGRIPSPGAATGLLLVTALWIFVACLIAAIALEIIAPTGSIPGPREAFVRCRAAVRRMVRYLHIVRAVAGSGLGGAARRGPASPEFGPALVRACNRCGVTFVKLGQILGTRDDILPPDTARALSSLQSDAAAIATADVHGVIAAELAAPVDEVFAHIEDRPLAAASVAQVHAARTRDGRAVVLKVQRPGAKAQVDVDCDILLRFAATAEARFPWARDLAAGRLAEGLVASLRQELDYRIEAANTAAVAGALRSRQGVVVPAVDTELSTGRLLVMERLDGTPLSAGEDAVGGLDERERRRLAGDLLGSLLDGIFLHGVFHADLHPGNIMVLADGRLGLLDFGSVGVLDSETRTLLATLLQAIVSDDAVGAVDAMLMAFDAPADVDATALRREVGREITLLRLSGRLSADAFGRIFAILRRHRIGVPGDVAAALRSLASVERALAALTPGVELLTAVGAELPRLLAALLSPQRVASQAIAQTAVGLAVARRLPGRLDAVGRAAAAGEFTVRARAFADESDRRWARDLATDAVSALLGIAAFVAAVVFLVVPGGPMLTPRLPLFTLLGAGIGFGGVVLGLRVVVRVFSRRS